MEKEKSLEKLKKVSKFAAGKKELSGKLFE